jgi:uncharacterized heparinase superfamily protein
MRLPQPIRLAGYRMARITPRSLLHAIARVWFNGLFYYRTLAGRRPRQLTFTALNPWPGDAKRGAELLRGEFCFAGHVETAPGALWRPRTAPTEWLTSLHSFEWLADLHAVGSDAARARARELIESWIETESRWRPIAWRPDVVAERLINWLGHAEFLFAGAEGELATRWLDHVARQGRHLRRLAPLLDPGVERLLVAKALIYAGICLQIEAKRLAKWMAMLAAEIDAQVAGDGGHISRSPAVHFAVFRQLVDLRIALREARAEIPVELQNAIDRMAPMVRFYRHGDGGLALFNDTNEGENWLIDVVLTQAEARGKPLETAPHTGYERIAINRTLVLMDTGPIPPAGADSHAHAGALSFEMSVGKHRMVVNCGAHAGAHRDWKAVQRTTAAHSTLTIDDINSAELLPGAIVGARPRLVGAQRRDSDGNVWIDGEIVGYAGFSRLVHRRRLYLAANGGDLRGEDSVEGAGRRKFAVRFHLHPTVTASLAQDGESVLLRLGDGVGWRFRASGGATGLQESVYLGIGGETRRTEQIVVSSAALDGAAQVKWAFTRMAD